MQKDIKKITDDFDLVMFPVDGRIGNDYTLGGRQFIDRFKVGMLVPMHFTGRAFKPLWRFNEFLQSQAARPSVQKIRISHLGKSGKNGNWAR